MTSRSRRNAQADPGQLDRRIEIQRQEETRDNFGSLVISWVKVAEVWASHRAISQSEAYNEQARRVVASRRSSFRIRYRPDLIETMRLIYDGLAWDLEGINDFGGGDVLELFAKYQS